MIWPFTTIATLRRELQDATARVNALHLEIDRAARREERRLAEIGLLSRALEAAQKNDTTKDTKSGKFTKKAKNV
jgi:hypothetical protein